VSLRQIGGLATISVDDPDVTGDDATLMNDFLVTSDPDLESCLFIEGLENGTYDVVLYARMPAAPDVKSYTDCDQEPAHPFYEVGGDWSGHHEELVSYSYHAAQVVNGALWLHSGIVPGHDPKDGAALNGVQIHKVDPCPADIDDTDDVGFSDLLAVLSAWGPCPGCHEDIDGDGNVAFADLLEVLSAWGECP
jgi:hypothetical protein